MLPANWASRFRPAPSSRCRAQHSLPTPPFWSTTSRSRCCRRLPPCSLPCLLGCALVVLVAPRQRQALERLLDLAQAEDVVDSLQPFLPHAEFNRADDGGNIARKEFLFGDQFREGANARVGRHSQL